nr:AAA family ATPase [Kribbella qitaiheensis]
MTEAEMAAEVPLRMLEVRGLTSLSHAVLELSSPVTLLVGPNGAGKSNVVNAFEMLGRIIDQQLNDSLLTGGGFGALLHRPTDPSLTPDAIELEVWGEWQGNISNGYNVRVEAASDDSGLVRETMLLHDRARFERPYSTTLAATRESTLRFEAEHEAKAAYVLGVVAGCRVFHFDDTSADAPVKRRVDPADNLAPDARNLAAVLLRLRTEEPSSYRRVIPAVRTVAPYFDDFVLEPEATRSGSVGGSVGWTRSSPPTTSATAPSDLFACLFSSCKTMLRAPSCWMSPSSVCIRSRSTSWPHYFGGRRAIEG